MAVWSEIEYSNVDVTSRIDSEYFLPDFVKNEKTMMQIKTKPLPYLFHVSDGNHLGISQYFTDKTGAIPYFRGKDINDFFLENASPIRVPYSIFNSNQMKRSHFKTDDVLLSIVGTIGSLSIVPDTINNATGSCKIAILKGKGVLSPYYLAAFLLSKYGQLQMNRNTRGAVQMGLILKDLIKILIPIILVSDETNIENLVKNAIEKNKQSKSLYLQAQELLEHELGLDTLKFEKPVGYEVNFSDAILSSRTDAEYFQPQYIRLSKALRKSALLNGREVYKIKELLRSSPKYGSSKKLKYVEAGVPFLRIADLSNLKFDKDKLKYISTKEAYEERNAQVKTDDILISLSGTLGLTIRITSELDGSIFGSYFIRLQLNEEINPRYFSFYMNSLPGKMQVERYNTGGVQTNLTIPAIESFQVVLLKKKKEEQLLGLITQAEESLKESKELLEKAKQKVENLIEQAAGET